MTEPLQGERAERFAADVLVRIDGTVNPRVGASYHYIVKEPIGGPENIVRLVPVFSDLRYFLISPDPAVRCKAWVTPEAEAKKYPPVPLNMWNRILGYTADPSLPEARQTDPAPGLHPVYWSPRTEQVLCFEDHQVLQVRTGTLDELMLMD